MNESLPTTVLHEFPSLGRLRTDIKPTFYQGFSGARVWKIEAETGKFAVRQWPAGWDNERLAGLHLLLHFLRDGGLDFVAPPVPSRRGVTVVSIDGSWWQVEPWRPGCAENRAQCSRARLAAAMSALARWHLRAAQFVPPYELQRWFFSHPDCPSFAVRERRARLLELKTALLEESVRQCEASAVPECCTQLRRLLTLILEQSPSVLSELDLAARVTLPLQPVLRDVWRDHVLFTGDDVTGLIDPSACRTESVAADLARLIGSLVGDDNADWDFAVAEYERHRPLSQDERALIPVLDRSGVLLSAVTWLEWLGPQRRLSVDDPRVLPRLRELTARLERFSSPRGNQVWTQE